MNHIMVHELYNMDAIHELYNMDAIHTLYNINTTHGLYNIYTHSLYNYSWIVSNYIIWT
jgi:hypothetical protein